MKKLDAHETEAVVDSRGGIVVSALPFSTGERVRVLVLRDQAEPSAPRHSVEEIHRSEDIRRSLQGTVIRFDAPDEPVGLEDWEVLQDGGNAG